MMAQHILTKPVFDALFENYDFSARNPMALALDNLQKDFTEFGLESETKDLEGFLRKRSDARTGVLTTVKDGKKYYQNSTRTSLSPP